MCRPARSTAAERSGREELECELIVQPGSRTSSRREESSLCEAGGNGDGLSEEDMGEAGLRSIFAKSLADAWRSILLAAAGFGAIVLVSARSIATPRA
jgi:hypothetical protein